MRVAVIGCGNVGLVAAACLAELGHDVICVDTDREKITLLDRGESLIHEEYLPELLARHRGNHLFFSWDLEEAVRQSLIVIIAVGTPAGESGDADLSYVETATREIAKALNSHKVIVEKSAVPVQTNAWIERAMVLNGCSASDFDVVSNPEFLREGTAVTDFLYPDRIIVGSRNEKAATSMRQLYSKLLDGSYSAAAGAIPVPADAMPVPLYLDTSPEASELIKHASNAFLAMKISFINAVSVISEATGADIEDVRVGLGSDKRIGQGFLRAGIGYGGSCFPKDVSAFQAIADACGIDFKLLQDVRQINEDQLKRFIAMVRKALLTVKGKRLAVLGLAFKSDTDDVRNSPAIKVVRELLEQECQISVYDPAAMERARTVLNDSVNYAADPYLAMNNADALLILTEWKQFSKLDLTRVRTLLKYPIVLDGRNLYSAEQMREAGLSYYSIGRPPVEVLHPVPVCANISKMG